MMQSNATFVNALSFFQGPEFCGAWFLPPFSNPDECKAFAEWFTMPAFTVLGQVIGLSEELLCQLVYQKCK